MAAPLLQVDGLRKVYTRGILNRQETFRLEADFAIEEPAIVGMMGPNGSGKTTLFELITGSNSPSAGRVLCLGRDVHNIKYRERDRLAIHYHQSYQVRHFKKTRPSFLLEPAGSDYPMVHLFDEPQFNTQDGYIGFMLDFFRKLRAQGRLVFLCVHPNEPFHLDIRDPDAIDQAWTSLRRDHGDVDVLVNNAGVLSNNKAAETTPEEWRRLMSVNLDGAFYMSRAALPAMKAKRWGRIVNLCSLAMKTGGLTAGTAYTASKGGLAALTFSLARESAGDGVTANGIAPAYIKTPMVTEQLTEAQRRKLLAEIPVGRFCEPEEIAHVVRFLVSPLAGFITGEIIDINGGLHLD